MDYVKKIFAAILLTLVAYSTNVMKAQQMPDLPVDEAVRIGKLDNGLTYYIRHNDYPEHKANFFIAQRVGSMQEEDNQRGLAHFLEHMAFNGSEHFAGNGIIDYTRTLGLEFGVDLNAMTSFNHTIYLVSNVPSTRQEALDSCLLILKDWSHGLLLEDEEIDKERGVIHQEWRTRSYEKRLLGNELPVMYPDSKHGQRMIIGLMDVIDNFPYQALRDYYDKWYRPDNQALVIVGDVDVDYTESKIREMFKDIPAPAADAAQVEPFPVPDNEQGIYFVNTDVELPRNYVEIMFKHETIDKALKTNTNYLILNYFKEMMCSMINSRFSELAMQDDCPFTAAYCSDAAYLIANTKDAFTVECYPKEGKTEAAVQAAMGELMRVCQHGFTATEYIRAQQNYMSDLESRYNERDKIHNTLLSMSYCYSFLEGEPVLSVADEYQLMNMIIPNATDQVVNPVLQQMLAEYVGDTDENMVVISYEADRQGAVHASAASLKSAADAARQMTLDAYVDNVKQEPLMSNVPAKGKIVKQSENSKLGYKVFTLSNGATVIPKQTDFMQDEINMLAVQRGGKSLYGEKDHANLKMMDYIEMIRTKGSFTSSELQKALAGQQVSVRFMMDTYFDIVSSNSTVKDLETMFQLVHLAFTDNRKDQQGFNKAMAILSEKTKNRSGNLDVTFNDEIQSTLFDHNWRYTELNVDDLQGINHDRVLEIANERTANAANYTFIFVGAFDENTILPLIEQYIASLPAKKGKPANWNNVLTLAHGQVNNHYTAKMETPKTYADITWFDDKCPSNIENSIKCQILSGVLTKIYLKKIREDAGAAYSAYATGMSALCGDRPFTCVEAHCPMKPEFTQEGLEILNNEMVNACNTVDESTVNDLKETLINNYNTQSKTNNYWMNVIMNNEMMGLDIHSDFVNKVKAQTPETIAAFARQLLNAGNKVEVVMTPAE